MGTYSTDTVPSNMSDPSTVIDGILKDVLAQEAAESDEFTGTVTDPEPAPNNPDAKPTVQPSTEPEADPTVQPVTPESLPPGTPGTTDPEQVPPTGEDQEGELSFLSPPGGPIWGDDSQSQSATIKLSDGTELTLAQVEALIHAPQLAHPNPNLTPGPASAPAPVPPADLTPTFQLPAFTEEDLENPAVRAVVMIAAKQQEELSKLREQQEAIADYTSRIQHRENAEIVNSAVSQFKATYNIPDELMEKVSTRAADLLPAEAQRQAETGNLNPFVTVTNALTNAYWLVPEARQFEFDRQASARQAALARQRRLNGIGGSSGTAPRTTPPPDTSTKEGLYQSMVAEVAAAMGLEEGNE